MPIVYIILFAALLWMMVETDWLRIQLPTGKMQLNGDKIKETQLTEEMEELMSKPPNNEWQLKIIHDVMDRLKTTGAIISLPRKASVEGVLKVALAGVFLKISELMDMAEIAIDRVASGNPGETEQPAPVVPAAVASNGLLKDEEEWLEYLKGCRVLVHDADVGRVMMKEALETAIGFKMLIGSLVEYQDLVVPILDYPGVKIFKKNTKSTEKSIPKIAKQTNKLQDDVAEEGEALEGDSDGN